jgi:ADP-ribose pyrophosphatase
LKRDGSTPWLKIVKENGRLNCHFLNMESCMSDTPEIMTLTSTIVYENRWMKVREDKIQRPSGQTGIYGVVEKADFAVIAAMHNHQLMLVQQYRYPVQRRYWELPQGSWEQSSIAPLDLARAELQEETGLIAKEMQHVGHLFLGYGYSTQGYDIFFASGIEQSQTDRDPEEEDLIARWFPLSEVKAMLLSGEICDATTAAAIGLLTLHRLI